MDFGELKAMIGPDDVRAVLDSQIYQTFVVSESGSRDPVDAAITAAASWAWSIMSRCRADQAPEPEVLKAALVKRAVFELFAGGENDVSAEDKKADAEALLVGLFGDCARLAEGKALISGKVARDDRLQDLQKYFSGAD